MKTIPPVLAFLVFASATAQQATPAPIRILAPETAGGAYDSLAHAIADTLNATKQPSVGPASVYNQPGLGGVTGMRGFVKLKGQPYNLIVLGMTTVGRLHMLSAPGVSLNELTPIARLTADYEVIVVPKASPYKTLDDVVKAFKQNPSRVRFGGGSAGGAGYLFIASVLRAAGAAPSRMPWVESSGNYQGIRAMYPSGGSALDVASASYGVAEADLRAGRLRALALSAPTPIPNINVKTATQLGYKTSVVNWRGVFAPASLPAEEVSRLATLFINLSRNSTWRNELNEHKLNSYFQPSVPFGYFLSREDKRIAQQISDLGLNR